MISFVDGPAKGVVLELRRCPLFLRVVQTPSGGWDALDQLDDEPEESETIYVYRRNDEPPPSRIHLCRRGKGLSGWFWIAQYSVLDEQPSDSEVRSTDSWRRWVTNRPEVKAAQAAAENENAARS
jgi:hypothetical protein